MAKKTKKISGFIKMQVPAGAATPAPVGPALGQRGLNIQEFCKSFNAMTEKEEKGLLLPVIITYFDDRTFTFIVKKPPMSILIRKSLGLEKGSGKPHTDKVGKLTRQAAEAIARTKMPDLNTTDIDAAVLQVAGTARSMGVETELE